MPSITTALKYLFQPTEFKALASEKKWIVAIVSLLPIITIVGIISSPFIWRAMVNKLIDKKITTTSTSTARTTNKTSLVSGTQLRTKAKSPPGSASSVKSTSKSPSISTTSSSKLSAKEKAILDDLSPQMVEALGGLNNVLHFPFATGWDGDIKKTEYFTAPVMRSATNDGSPILIFSYFNILTTTPHHECLCRRGNTWCSLITDVNELHLASGNHIVDNSIEATYMIDKITRLVKGEAVGTLAYYKSHTKPEDAASMPNNAYLKHKDLKNYIENVNSICYERKPKKGTTELFLFDPSLSDSENDELLQKKFPDMFN